MWLDAFGQKWMASPPDSSACSLSFMDPELQNLNRILSKLETLVGKHGTFSATVVDLQAITLHEEADWGINFHPHSSLGS
jgi:hypothetical protein